MSLSTNKRKSVDVTAHPYVVTPTDGTIFYNGTADSAFTLPDPSIDKERELRVVNYSAHVITSASANVRPLAGGAATNAILAAAGKTLLKSDGVNWRVVD